MLEYFLNEEVSRMIRLVGEEENRQGFRLACGVIILKTDYLLICNSKLFL